MASKIDDNFCGRVTLDGREYFCMVNNHVVQLMLCEKDKHPFAFMAEQLVLPRQFIMGKDNQEFDFALFTHGHKGYPRFFSPLIIKDTANLTPHHISSFNKIRFIGGTINYVYSTQQIIDHEDCLKNPKNNRIRFRDYDDYTKVFPININGKSGRIKYGIDARMAGEYHSDIIGTMFSYIQLEFDETHELDVLLFFRDTIKSVLSFLVGQRNVEFKVNLYNDFQAGKETLSLQTAHCKAFDGHENYFNGSYHNVIPLGFFGDKLPILLEMFSKKEFRLEFLPDNNNQKTLINYNSIRDLCTALEVEYDILCIKNKANGKIKALRVAMKTAIEAFKSENEDLDITVYNKAISDLKYVGHSAANKVVTLYHRYKKQIDDLCKSFFEKLDVEITEETISAFIKLRDTITHTWDTKLDEACGIYALLQAIVYFAIFERTGFTAEQSFPLVKRLIFGR